MTTTQAFNSLVSGDYSVTSHAIESFRIRVANVSKVKAEALIRMLVGGAVRENGLENSQNRDGWVVRIGRPGRKYNFLAAFAEANHEPGRVVVTTVIRPGQAQGSISVMEHNRHLDDLKRKLLQMEDRFFEFSVQTMRKGAEDEHNSVGSIVHCECCPNSRLSIATGQHPEPGPAAPGVDNREGEIVMPINNDFESLLDAMTDEGSKENDDFLALAERHYTSAFAELEPFFNRLAILSRQFRKWYKAYLLGGGRPSQKYDEMLKKIDSFKHIDADILPQVRAAQVADAPLVRPAAPIQVETPFGVEVVPPPRVPVIVHPVSGQLINEPRKKAGRSGNRGWNKEKRLAPVEDIAAFCNLVNEKFGEPPTGPMVAAQFGGTPSWGSGAVREALEAGLLDHPPRPPRQKARDKMLAIKVAKEFGRIK